MDESRVRKSEVGIPTYREVEEWCKARMSPVDPASFFDYYEEAGWMTKSGEPIRNWRKVEMKWEAEEYQKIDKWRSRLNNKSSNPFLREYLRC